MKHNRRWWTQESISGEGDFNLSCAVSFLRKVLKLRAENDHSLEATETGSVINELSVESHLSQANRCFFDNVCFTSSLRLRSRHSILEHHLAIRFQKSPLLNVFLPHHARKIFWEHVRAFRKQFTNSEESTKNSLQKWSKQLKYSTKQNKLSFLKINLCLLRRNVRF